MLYRLRIRNFAIIDEIDMVFSPGFNVLTGETGAGKSIIIDAIGLLLGERASQNLIRTGKQETYVEGEFFISKNKAVKSIMEENGWPPGDELIIRREISRSGRSHAFLNGRMVPVSYLQKLGKCLVDIHGQHDHQSLFSTILQKEYLDQYGKCVSLRDKVSKLHSQYRNLEHQVQYFEKSRIQRSRQIDLLQYQVSEIEQAKIADPEEYDNLVTERQRLVHSEKLVTGTQKVYHELFEHDRSVFDTISSIQTRLDELSNYDPEIKPWVSKLEEIALQCKEIADFCREYQDSVEFSPADMETIEDRIKTLDELKRKYGPGLNDVCQFLVEKKKELEQLKSFEEKEHDNETKLNSLATKLVNQTSELSRLRKKTSTSLEKEVLKLLSKLGLPNTKFKVRFHPVPEICSLSERFLPGYFTAHGYDSIEFLIATNPDEEPKPLNKVVSGGELSRIMLGLKNILVSRDDIPTMVFDEIDQGIGGATAEIVGQVIKSVATKRQVLCITHLAQIACQANSHFVVEKFAENNKTLVNVKELNRSERVDEISRMIGGVKSSKDVQRYAQLLLKAGSNHVKK